MPAERPPPRILPAFAAALALAAPPALAQGVFDMGMLANTLSQGANIQSERARASSEGAFRSILRAPPGARIDRAALVYRPDMAVRKRDMAGFVARLRRVDPTAAGDLERTLERRDLVAEIGSVMRPVGLDPDNVADAMAAYLVTAYYGVRGSTEGEPAEFKAVSAQAARALSADAAFAGASDALKQEIAESLLVHALLANQAVQAAQKQPSAMPAVRTAIAEGARSAFGLDLAGMRLGPDGLG